VSGDWQKVQFATSDFYRIEEGKVVEHWDVVDSLPRAIALGSVPAPAQIRYRPVPLEQTAWVLPSSESRHRKAGA
jgi:hypothetical protein